jgi:hypothetical protein
MSPWIKCSERMPEDGQPALLAFKPDHDETPQEAYGFNETEDPEYIRECVREGHVTHWMPLPEPPTA